jgi:hypothetical protein
VEENLARITVVEVRTRVVRHGFGGHGTG